MQFTILIVDDDNIVCNSLKRILENDEYQISAVNTAEHALKSVGEEQPDLMIVDFKLPDMDGIKLLKKVKGAYPQIQVIILTAYGNISLAVEAMKNNAYDFIEKEAEPDMVRFTVQKALDNIRLKKEVQNLRDEQLAKLNLSNIVTESQVMKNLLSLVDQFSESDSTLLLTGETGTGKSIIAEYIHYKSRRFDQPFLTVNCGAIPRELIESELFGYEKGAFTGAHTRGKMGLLEKANHGTVFLDEISELSMDIQAKLLMVLERSEFFRVGGVDPVRVNVRFIVATNADLAKLIQQGQFRKDLYYRINVAPLRDRIEDILPLTKYFIDYFNIKFAKKITKITKTAEGILTSYPWPGNIRELRNIMERVMLLKRDEVIHERDFCLLNNHINTAEIGPLELPFCISFGSGKNVLHEAQKVVIEHVLKVTRHNKTKASQMLGIPRTSLQFYIDKFEIAKEQ